MSESTKIKIHNCLLEVPAEVWGKSHGFKLTRKQKCGWAAGGECGGPVFWAPLFCGRLEFMPDDEFPGIKRGPNVAVCAEHLSVHRIIISLNEAGLDIDMILHMSVKQRETTVLNMKLTPWDKI